MIAVVQLLSSLTCSDTRVLATTGLLLQLTSPSEVRIDKGLNRSGKTGHWGSLGVPLRIFHPLNESHRKSKPPQSQHWFCIINMLSLLKSHTAAILEIIPTYIYVLFLLNIWYWERYENWIYATQKSRSQLLLLKSLSKNIKREISSGYEKLCKLIRLKKALCEMLPIGSFLKVATAAMHKGYK